GGGGGSGGGGGPRQQSSEGHSGGSRSFSGYGYEGSASSGGRGQPGGQRSDQRHGGWNEPHGEGQRYSPGVQHGGQYGAQQSGSSGTGDHRGKGPKGYQRSDERLKEMICERLRDDPEIDPSEVSVTVQGGKVTLEGTVDSRHAKNAIEDVAEQFGVQDVQNFLRVQKATQMGGQSGEGGRGASTGKPGEDAGIVRNRH
ncbi:MAG TPA: BON domain-containing protein, partial [Vicinamibacterales bacterium]|nr:BON domain-containing protein [Vicinamibacterales bacterium]